MVIVASRRPPQADDAGPPPDPPPLRTPTVPGRILIACSILPALGLMLASFAANPAARADDKKPASVLDFQVKDIDGNDVALSKYQGKVLLIVNTASQCGLTPQYKGLEEVYEKYKGQGLEVLGFPANEFGAQEPDSNERIKEFCTSKYNVTFPMFSKIVVKGQGIHPLYAYLTGEATNPSYAGPIGWNFAKFLVNRKGEVVARFDPKTTPESPEVQAALEQALAEQ
jgi:glutathione peroxidase